MAGAAIDKEPVPTSSKGELVPKLIYQDPETGAQVVVTLDQDRPEVTIGRNPNNIIRINNPSVSRRHTKFVYEGGRCMLYDLNSSNGSYVNGMRVQSQVLEDGDLVRVGEFPLEFVDDIAPQQPAAPLGHQSPQIEPMSRNAMFDSRPGSDAAIEPDDYSMDALVLDDDDIHEMVPDEVYPVLDLENFSDDTVDGGPEIAASLAALRKGGQSSSVDEVDHTSRADGHALSLQNWEQSYDSEEQDAHTAAAPADLVTGLAMGGFGYSEAKESEPEFYDGPLESEQAVSAEVEFLRSQISELERRNEELVRALDRGLEGSGDAMVDRLRGERDRLSSERAAMGRQIEDLRAQLDAAPTDDDLAVLVNAREEAFRESKSLREELAGLKANYEGQSEEFSNLSAENQALQEELQAVYLDLQAYQQNSEALDSERSELGGHLELIQQELQDTKEELLEAQEENQVLVETLAAREQELSGLESEVGQRDQALDALQTQVQGLHQDLAVRNERIEALLSSVAERETALDSQRERIEALEAELSTRPAPEEADALASEAFSLRGQLEESRSHAFELEAALESVQVRQQELEQFIADLEVRHARVSQERDALRGERDNFKQEKAAYARETDYLQVERRKQADQLTDLQAEVAKFEKERAKKKKIFEELSQDLRGLVTENAALGSRVEELEKVLKSGPSPEEVEKLRREIEERDQLLSQLEEQVEELENDSSTLTRDLGEIGEERDRLEGRVNQLEEEIQSLRSSAQIEGDAEELVLAIEEEKKGLQKEREELAKERDALAAELEELRAKMETMEKADASQEELQEIAAEAETLRASLSNLQEEREELQQKVEGLQSELQNLKEAADAKGEDKELQKLLKEKVSLEEALAAMILERDQLEDELRQTRDAG